MNTNTENNEEQQSSQHRRDLKIVMTKDNLLELCNKDPEICDYIVKKNQSFDVCLHESMFMCFISFIDKNNHQLINLDMVLNEMERNFPKETDFEWMFEMFIRDYNKFYLDDEYWYGGKWYDEYWYKDDEDFDTQYKKYHTYTLEDGTSIVL
jgi:hypothetical protein